MSARQQLTNRLLEPERVPALLDYPEIHPSTGAPFVSWAPACELPEDLKARLRALVRSGAWEMADCAHIALLHQSSPRQCDELIWSAELAV